MEETQTITPLLDGHKYNQIKRCPKCTSLYITKDECEGCGYQLGYSPIGEAFGDKSFYGLKEDYWSKRSQVTKLWPRFENRSSKGANKYIRELLHRFNTLTDFLSGESEMDRRFFWLEFKELALELTEYSISPCSNLQNEGPVHGYAPLIYNFLKELELMKKTGPTRWDLLLDYKFAGVLRLRFLLISGITLAAISTTSLLVYQYFFLFS